MAAATAYVQLTAPNKVRVITATASDLTWVWGRRTTITYIFQSAIADVVTFSSPHTLETVIHEVEYATGGTTPVKQDTTIAAFFSSQSTSSTSGTLPNYDSANIKILDTTVMDYVRFTGTGLPAAGLYFDTTTVSGIFNVAPSANDSL